MGEWSAATEPGARWSAAQVLGLAPDAASAKAGQGSTSAALWSGTGQRDGYLWGLCRGSGKNPYQTVVELAGPAFRCSCPSRKFPCKHALGLLLLWSRDGLSIAEPADFAAAWRAERAERAEKAERGAAQRDASG
jgi:hypothetical protein